MKHLSITLIILLTAAIHAFGQTGLASNRLFTDKVWTENPDATETYLSGKSLRPYKLSIYRSLSLKDAPPETVASVRALVERDGRRAVDTEKTMSKGRLTYMFLRLPPLNGENRYLFYIDSGPEHGNKLTVIYMAGSAEPADITDMLKKR